jgi:flavin-dependent dehydrogenase
VSTNATPGDGNPAVVVIGGGPAGAAVARRLALRDRDVALLEATAFDGPRFGETLPPEANPLLRELGLWDAFLASGPLESPGIVSAWGSSVPSETEFLRNPHGSGWHVDRNIFDRMLCDAAARAGARVSTATRVTRCARDAGGAWRVETSAGATLAARFVVDASGRNGFRLGPSDARVVDDVLAGVFVRVAHDAPPADRRTLVESAPDGWWYCAPLPCGETVAVFLTDPEIYANDGIALAEQLAAAPLTRARIGTSRIVETHVVNVSSSCRAAAAGDGWAAAGDAAAAYDPISGYGITKALADADGLAAAIERALDGDAAPLESFARRVRVSFDAYAAQRRAYYASETRWTERPFWRKRYPRAIARTRSTTSSA